MSKPATIKSHTFIYSGKNREGKPVSGEISGNNLAVAKLELKKQGITPQKVRKKTKPFFSKSSKKITPADITIFSRQMATMLQAGIPLVQAFDIVGRGLEKPLLQELVATLKTDVEAGGTFAEALKKHPKYFNDLFCNLIEAGEQSGALELMLDNLATYKEKTESLKKKIKKALTYPSAVMVVAFLVSAALLIFVVPQFEDLFKGFGADLPAMTQMVINMSEVMQSYWYIVFGGLAAIGYSIAYALKHSEKFVFMVDKTMLRIPIIGPILKQAAIARFSRTLSITFAAGLPLVDALKSVAGATGNKIYYNATMEIRDSVSTGQQLQQAMRATNVFPNMVVQMVAIGEESGALESMLKKIADYYEEEVDTAVDSLSSLLEPMIMALLGVIVGGLVIAMYLPIFKLGQVV